LVSREAGRVSTPMRGPVLTDSERVTSAWKTIKEYAEQRIERLREKNDRPLDEVKTAHLRGQIEELRNLAALDKPAPQTEADDESA